MILNGSNAAWLCAALLVLGVLRTEAGCKAPCNQAPDHSKADYCIAYPNLNCQLPANYNCPPCGLWRNIKHPCQYHYSEVHGSSSPEWIIEPCEAVSGIEGILEFTHAASTNFLWAQAWGDGVGGKNGRPQISPSELGLVMNSFYYRSKHQMHIHAAKLDNGFAKHCLGSLPTSIKTSWEAPTDHSCDFTMLSKHTNSLDHVNAMIIEGAKALGIGDNKKIGALVSQDPSKNGFAVTVFEGLEYKGDHNILHYST